MTAVEPAEPVQPTEGRSPPPISPLDPEVMFSIRRVKAETGETLSYLAEDLETGIWVEAFDPWTAAANLAMKVAGEAERIRRVGKPGTRLYDWFADLLGWEG